MSVTVKGVSHRQTNETRASVYLVAIPRFVPGVRIFFILFCLKKPSKESILILENKGPDT